MAKIEFSQGFMSGLPQRILSKDLAFLPFEGPSNTGLIAGAEGSYPDSVFLEIFSGIKLTKSQLDASRSFSGSSPYVLARISNSLIRFTNGGITSLSGDFSPSLTLNPASISTVYKTAVLSGTASWFCLANTTGVGSNVFGNYIVGDIGAIGSGADLEIPSVNIISGELYRVTNFKINFPYFWEY